MSGKLKKLHEIEINTCTWRPAKKNMQKNCNQFIGFSIKLSSQNTGNGFSDHQDFKFFMENPPRSPSGSPNRCCHDSWVFKKYSNFTYSKKRLDSLLKYYQWRLSPNQPCDLFPVAMMSFTSVASILLETLINTWRSASPSSRQSAWKKKYDRRLGKATW